MSERECYERLYGERNPLVTVLPKGSGIPRGPTLSADRMRAAFRSDGTSGTLDDVQEAA